MKVCVLIVDDHAIIRKMLRSLFESGDFEVCEATNGAEGVQQAKSLSPALVVLDLSMPVMNGLDAARALKLIMPLVPLLMFTNHSGSALNKEARAAGVSAIVSKSESDSARQLLAHARTLLGLEGVQSQSVS